MEKILSIFFVTMLVLLNSGTVGVPQPTEVTAGKKNVIVSLTFSDKRVMLKGCCKYCKEISDWSNYKSLLEH